MAPDGVTFQKPVVVLADLGGRYQPMESEQRVATRQRVLKRGTIEFGGGAIDCTVRNISATGAALDVTSPIGIPVRFNLATEGNHIPCRIVWRKEKRIGVTFEKP